MSFLKYYSELPSGKLYSLEWGQVVQMGGLMAVPAAQLLCILNQLFPNLDVHMNHLWISLE